MKENLEIDLTQFRDEVKLYCIYIQRLQITKDNYVGKYIEFILNNLYT